MPRRPPAGLDPGAARPCCPSRRRLCVDPADAPFALHPPFALCVAPASGCAQNSQPSSVCQGVLTPLFGNRVNSERAGCRGRGAGTTTLSFGQAEL